MSEIAIKAEGLGKLYRIGQWQREDTLRNVIGPILHAIAVLSTRRSQPCRWSGPVCTHSLATYL